MSEYTYEKEVNRLFNEIHKITKNDKPSLPENTYFLRDGRILCLERKNGVSRFPYGEDGFTAWVYSSGYISINESTFYLFLPSEEGKEPYMAFFAGEKKANGQFRRISLLGQARNLEEGNVKRYVVYGKDAAYFLTETATFKYSVRFYVTAEKRVVISLLAIPKGKSNKEIYLSGFMNALFKYSACESMETKWFKKCSYSDNKFLFESHEDIDRTTHVLNYGVITRILRGNETRALNTTSRSIYADGRESSIAVSKALLNGDFSKEKLVTHFTDTAVAGDIIHYSLNTNCAREDYLIDFTHLEDKFNELISLRVNEDSIDSYLYEKRVALNRKYNSKNMLKLSFKEMNNPTINDNTLNLFLKNVIYQTEYCGLAKNSGAIFLGVRDVMQQIDAALMWNPNACRQKILEVLDYIDPSGNPPRQYSIPPKGSIPRMDLRPFIDQGVWIIDTVYNYLAYTGDYTILNCKLGYYERIDSTSVKRSSIIDTVLDHLLRVLDYLISHIDENTGCLRAMYGDWNDALDGLGVSKKHDGYGNGVSVMATLQLYRNLEEMIELLGKLNLHTELIFKFKQIRLSIEQGIKSYAIVSDATSKKIIHGWGEDLSYFVGSYCDVDGKSRDSLTANAFYVLSGMNKKHYLDKNDLLKAFDNLDSKYGLKTFEPYFDKGVKGVGRIVNLPKGTAENGATYIHATLFGAWCLFKMNEGKRAFEQIEKVLPLTHKMLSTTPFVMSNSYSYNLSEDMDGESMSDWYTGSANTLIKALVRGLFGINPTLSGLELKPVIEVMAKEISCNIKIRKANLKVTYRTLGKPATKIIVNGEEHDINGVYLSNEYIDVAKSIDVIIC